MPELPEVETTVRGLRQVLDGRILTRVEARRADLRRAFPLDLRQRLTGARVTGLGRRAKYGLIETDRGDTMVFHLGMSGRWRVDPAAPEKHDHLLLETDQGRAVVLNDHRRFGSVDLVPSAELPAWPPFAALGPEPLGEGLTAQGLKRAFQGRTASIKSLLLDQRVVAGLGNIYVLEALFIARVRPSRAAGTVSAAKLKLLVPAIKAVLLSSIEAGGSTLRDFAHPDGELGYFAKQFAVYGREGKPCMNCCRPIVRTVEGGRSSFWCRNCQR